MQPEITPALLHELFDIDFEAGSMKWKVTASRFAGREAGSMHEPSPDTFYWRISLCGQRHKRGRLIYLAYHGEWPEPTVDHFNRDSLDDRISNLRPASRALQAVNRRSVFRRNRHPDLPTGVLHRENRRYSAAIMKDAKNIHIGMFDTAEDAHQAYLAKRLELFGSLS